MSARAGDRELHDHGSLVAAVAVRHLGAHPGSTTVRGQGDRLDVADGVTAWEVRVTDAAEGRPFTLLEYEPELTPVDHPGPLPLVAVVGDTRTFLLSKPRDLAAFLEAAAERSEPALIAALVVLHAADGVEHVVTHAELAPAGEDALREAGVAADPPSGVVDADGTWRLRFVTAQLHGPARGGQRGVDFRLWTVTVHPPGGGVDWQAHPVALGVAAGLNVGALFAKASRAAGEAPAADPG